MFAQATATMLVENLGVSYREKHETGIAALTNAAWALVLRVYAESPEEVCFGLLSQYNHVVEQLVSQPETCVRDIQVLSPEDIVCALTDRRANEGASRLRGYVCMGRKLFTTSMRGGCVCVPSESERLSDLAGAVNKYRVNWSFHVPTTAETLDPEQMPGLKHLALGGEAISRWASRVTLLNSYGPSECSIWTSVSHLHPGISSPNNIGRGLGCRTWITEANDHNRLVAIGCVDRCCLHREPNICEESGHPNHAHLYKTGDLIKYDSNATILYVGRKDSQVKARGQRIELPRGLGRASESLQVVVKKRLTWQTITDEISFEQRGLPVIEYGGRLCSFAIDIKARKFVLALHHVLSSRVRRLLERSTEQYTSFTSGRTGRLKGIVVEHGNLRMSAQAYGAQFKVNPGTRVFQFSAYTFDIGLGDIFISLQRGATICTPPEWERLNELSGAITKYQANFMSVTPSVAKLLRPEVVPTLCTLVLGETPTQDNVQTWLEKLELVITWGPAETTIYESATPPTTRETSAQGLGNPRGQSNVAGPLVSRGYLKDDAKTAAAYIEDPAWAKRLDRKDNQVKLHGQRMELDEVEHAMLAHKTVRQAIARIPRHGPLKDKLVAMMSPHDVLSPSSPVANRIIVLNEAYHGIRIGRELACSGASVAPRKPAKLHGANGLDWCRGCSTERQF
ncbi:acetyl-CoA synthetase-like protein [Aspergillus heteromorphus CBS 117.55]|uniref:Acetyl-CoA synthetase-like protein n=1 Tax=Aspergillus heteromorphus CBS 117.55 TaxID=1448321 RepID=A0A317WED0_9EURO|nr:acetyl-CoA synthetase-like protein [Aspergillus heteromorphus CBS 117.55]PWY83582.1 acetyl-CoA synthetase-like protein [Aspergillus heteromorphus CBS 117.55]